MSDMHARARISAAAAAAQLTQLASTSDSIEDQAKAVIDRDLVAGMSARSENTTKTYKQGQQC